jgi:kynureninase
VIELDELRRTPNALAPHYSHARVADRLLLTGHSHQAWPDVALQGQIEAFEDAASAVDEKWERAFAKADQVRAWFARWLGAASAAEIALGASTHDLIIRFLSALDLRGRPRLVTTDAEFHTLRRQTRRLAEAGLEIEVVAAEPAETLAERLADAASNLRTRAVLASSVLFETARIVPHLSALAGACEEHRAELLVDVYHALGPVPTSISELGLQKAWIVGGGYKYLQLGEGNCFLRLPEHAQELRPVVTGWYAEFDALTAAHGDDRVGYGTGPWRFAGSTYDPTSHYRAARVSEFFLERGLTPELLASSYRHQMEVLAQRFDELGAPAALITRDTDTPLSSYGGFLALRTPHAAALQRALREREVLTDSRGDYLRLGPAPYLCDAQLAAAVDRLGDALSSSRLRGGA